MLKWSDATNSQITVFGCWILGSVGWLAASTLFGGDTAADARRELDRDFRTKLESLAELCRQLELPDQAETTSSWFVERDPRRLVLFLVLDADSTRPDKAAPEVVHQWHHKFMEHRRLYAASLFRLAGRILDNGDATAAYQLLHEVLREAPDHAQARSVLGFRRRGDVWHKASTRISRRSGRTAHPSSVGDATSIGALNPGIS